MTGLAQAQFVDCDNFSRDSINPEKWANTSLEGSFYSHYDTGRVRNGLVGSGLRQSRIRSDSFVAPAPRVAPSLKSPTDPVHLASTEITG